MVAERSRAKTVWRWLDARLEAQRRNSTPEADKIARSLKDLGVVRGQWKMPIGVGGGPERTLSTLELTPAAREHLIRNGLTPWGSDNPRDMVRAMKALPIRVSMRGNFWNG